MRQVVSLCGVATATRPVVCCSTIGEGVTRCFDNAVTRLAEDPDGAWYTVHTFFERIGVGLDRAGTRDAALTHGFGLVILGMATN